MRAAFTREPVGRAYSEAMGDWLEANGFDEIDKGVRSRLRQIWENLSAITAWRQTLPLSERLKLNHPNTVVRRWQAAMPKSRGGEPAEKPAGLRAEVARLQGEVDRMKSNGGNLFSSQDRAGDIANVIFEMLPEHKLKAVLEECLVRLEVTAEEVKRLRATAKQKALNLVKG